MTDLISRLRDLHMQCDGLSLYAEAADEIERLRAALEVYADPGFYHACMFMFDRPTGGFDEDFDYDEDYERDMPGKLARAALKEPT